MNIIVLCGGLSSERDVSISTGSGAARALRALGHNAVLVDLFFGYTGQYAEPAEIFSHPQPDEIYRVSESEPDLDAVRAMRGQENVSLIGGNIKEICRAADIVFLALHGEEGENGKLQAMFDLEGIKYTGSGYLGSALAMNKTLTKKLLADAGIPTPPGVTVTRGDTDVAGVGFPCVVKPCSGGSSVGTSIVRCAQEYRAALDLAFTYEEKVIVEKYIQGRELTVGVMDGEAMPVIEIIPKSGFYDYKNKYQAGCTVELCPAPITDEQTRAVQELSCRVQKALMIEAYCRVDFILAQSGEYYCLEANTLPGMTPTSLIPQMGAVMGLDYPALCQRIIDVSLKRYQK